MSFHTYKEYKNTGVEWLGKLPAHWDVFPLKAGFNLMKRPPPENCGVVTAFRDGEVTLRSNRRMDGFTEAFQEIGYQGVEPDDLVIHAMDAFAGAIGVSDSKGKSTPVYSVCEPKKDYFSRYYGLVLRHIALAGYIQSLAKGIRERSTDFRWSDAKNIPVPHPSIDEQKTIINFLDYEAAKIDTLVAEQEKLIELLKEKRRTVISRAVTKGLDLTIKMKYSGVEWLGEVPDHWVVKKIKFVVDVLASNVDKKTYEGDTPCLLCNYTDVYYNDQIVKDMEFMSATATPEQINKFTLRKGDVIITKDSESPDDIAIAAYVPIDLTGVVCGYHLSIIRAFEINGMFVKRLFDSHYLKSKFATLANGLTRYGLGQHSINNVYIPIPPEEEQQQIVDFITKTCNGIDDLIDKSKTSINLLTERRLALISAAVTGQIDVRNYQAKDIA
jgi:type I restriction enzyme S subunit